MQQRELDEVFGPKSMMHIEPKSMMHIEPRSMMHIEPSSAQSFRNRHPLGSHIPLSLEHLGIPATAMQLWASLLLQCECYCTASLLLQCKCIPATANATALHPCYCTASLLLHCIVANVMNAVLQMLLFSRTLEVL